MEEDQSPIKPQHPSPGHQSPRLTRLASGWAWLPGGCSLTPWFRRAAGLGTRQAEGSGATSRSAAVCIWRAWGAPLYLFSVLVMETESIRGKACLGTKCPTCKLGETPSNHSIPRQPMSEPREGGLLVWVPGAPPGRHGHSDDTRPRCVPSRR